MLEFIKKYPKVLELEVEDLKDYINGETWSYYDWNNLIGYDGVTKAISLYNFIHFDENDWNIKVETQEQFIEVLEFFISKGEKRFSDDIHYDEDECKFLLYKFGNGRYHKTDDNRPDTFGNLKKRITWEQFQFLKENLNNTMKKMITGYKAPIDLFRGEIKVGTTYILRDDCYIPLHKHINRNNSPYDFVLPKEIVESWEPVYNEEFQVGDWVASDKFDSFVGQLIDIQPDRFYYKGFNAGREYQEKDWYTFTSILDLRKATPEEIKKASSVTINNYQARVKSDRIYFGTCHYFTKKNLESYLHLVTLNDTVEIKVHDTLITKEMLNKLIGMLENQ